MTRKAKKWLSALAAGLIALTIGVTQYDLDPGWAALSSRLNDRLMAMFVDVAGFNKTGVRITFATETSARLPSRINDRWMQAFASCGSGQTCLRVVDVAGGGGGGAPDDALYVTLGLDATLSAERVLTGTVNQITITDGGANTTVTLSTPQDIHTGANPTFETLNLNAAVNQIVLDADGSDTGTITAEALSLDQTWTFPDASGEISLLGQTIDLASEVTGTLPVGNGGMGATSHTDGAILLGNAAGAITNLGVLADDTLVLGDGVTDPGTASVPNCVATDSALNYTAATNTFSCQAGIGAGGGAPATAQYVTLALDATLSAERVLTGTVNQIVITDGGANTTVTLSTPQDIHTAAAPTFASLDLNDAVNQIKLDADEGSGFVGTITLDTLTAARSYTFPDASGEVSLLGQAIDLASEVTGTLPVGNGGTGATSHTDGAILLGNAAGAITNLGVLADDTLVLGDGVTDPGLALIPDCDGADEALNYDVTTNTITCQTIVGSGGGAPSGATYVVLSLDATLSAERVLTGTTDQIIITDGGANTTVTLSTPQDIALTSSPTFAAISLNNATNQIILDADQGSGFTGTITIDSLTAARVYTFPDAGGEVSLLGQLIDLTSEITGVLDEANGGTGQSSYTKGDILVATGAATLVKLAVGTDGDLIVVDSATSEGIKYDSISAVIGNTGIIDTDAADVTVVNTTTETSVYSFTIDANTLGTKNAIRLFIQGRVTDGTGGSPQVLTVRFKYGATTLVTRTIESVTGITDQGYPFSFMLMADGATGAQEAMMKLQRDIASASTVPTNIARGTGAEDSTAALLLDVTVEWDVADATLEYTMEYAVLEVLNSE